jgi:hypothetical protein
MKKLSVIQHYDSFVDARFFLFAIENVYSYTNLQVISCVSFPQLKAFEIHLQYVAEGC